MLVDHFACDVVVVVPRPVLAQAQGVVLRRAAQVGHLVLSVASEDAVWLLEEVREHTQWGWVHRVVAERSRRDPYCQCPVAQFVVACKIKCCRNHVSSDKMVGCLVLRTDAMHAVED